MWILKFFPFFKKMKNSINNSCPADQYHQHLICAFFFINYSYLWPSWIKTSLWPGLLALLVFPDKDERHSEMSYADLGSSRYLCAGVRILQSTVEGAASSPVSVCSGKSVGTFRLIYLKPPPRTSEKTDPRKSVRLLLPQIFLRVFQ